VQQVAAVDCLLLGGIHFVGSCCHFGRSWTCLLARHAPIAPVTIAASIMCAYIVRAMGKERGAPAAAMPWTVTSKAVIANKQRTIDRAILLLNAVHVST
jgi:hypothetical protein